MIDGDLVRMARMASAPRAACSTALERLGRLVLAARSTEDPLRLRPMATSRISTDAPNRVSDNSPRYQGTNALTNRRAKAMKTHGVCVLWRQAASALTRRIALATTLHGDNALTRHRANAMNPHGAPGRLPRWSLSPRYRIAQEPWARRPIPEKGRGSHEMRSIAVVNQKGGSGKTTTALCLAVGAAMRGRRVLLLDSDPQANSSTVMLDGEPAADPTLSHVLLDQVEASEAIRSTRVEGLDVLPADGKLADAALVLADQLGRERRLRVALETIADDYDLVVVDAAPQLSLVGINVLNAVRELLVPVDAGAFSIAGLGRLQESVEQVRRYLDNHALRIGGLVMTRTHANRATKDILDQLRGAFGSLVHQTTIPHSVRVEEAHARHRTVLEFAPKSTPALAYQNLVSEVLDDVKAGTRNTSDSVAADEADAA